VSRLGSALAGVLLVAALASAEAPSPRPERPNGFSLTRLLVDRAEIVAGGPARDAINSIDEQRFVPPGQATWV
jgi:hypothetical protein